MGSFDCSQQPLGAFSTYPCDSSMPWVRSSHTSARAPPALVPGCSPLSPWPAAVGDVRRRVGESDAGIPEAAPRVHIDHHEDHLQAAPQAPDSQVRGRHRGRGGVTAARPARLAPPGSFPPCLRLEKSSMSHEEEDSFAFSCTYGFKVFGSGSDGSLPPPPPPPPIFLFVISPRHRGSKLARISPMNGLEAECARLQRDALGVGVRGPSRGKRSRKGGRLKGAL